MTPDTKTLKKIRTHLIDLLTGERRVTYAELGLCTELQRYRVPLFNLVDVRQWSLYSGDPIFPIPHPTKTPKIAYLHTDNMWNSDPEDADNTQYAKNRRLFTAWLAAQLTIQLETPRWRHNQFR